MAKKEIDVSSKFGEVRTNSTELNPNYVQEGTNESGKGTVILNPDSQNQM